MIMHADPRGNLAPPAEGAGPAEADERRRLFRSLARSAQEVRLLSSVLTAVTSAGNIDDLLSTVGFGIKDLLPYERWPMVGVALLDADHDREGLQVYQIVGEQSSPYWSNIGRGLRDAAHGLGVEVSYLSATMTSEVTQVGLIERAIREGFDGIALAPVDAEALEPAIRQARRAGIPVVTFDSPPIAASESLVYIGTDNVQAGRLAGETMARLLPGAGEVAISVEHLRTENVRQRLQGFREALAATRLSPLPPFESRLDRRLGYQLSRQQLVERPQLAGAFGVCNLNGPAWGRAISDEGRASAVKLVAFDMVADNIALLKVGIVHAAIAQREYDMGYRSVQILSRMATDGVEATLAALPHTRVVDTGVDVVTLEDSPHSISLASYLSRASELRVGDEERAAVARVGRPIRLMAIGILEHSEPGVMRSARRLRDEPFVGQVLAGTGTLVVDPAREPALATPRERGTRTLVGVPLQTERGIVGALVLESREEQACTLDERATLERVAGAVVVALENARLFRQADERRRALEEASQRQELLLQTVIELSSPIAPIVPGILVMPLVGAFDSQRAAHFTESLLQAVLANRARVVLVDISAVTVVDTHVANHLIRSAQAVRMLGGEMVLVGIAPAVAQTIVQLGIEMTQIVTRADLASGFRYALARLGGRVVFDEGARASAR
jgi:ABC-type sugar transport system substrate-binding protein/anti-anti-sigma regulatory factor